MMLAPRLVAGNYYKDTKLVNIKTKHLTTEGQFGSRQDMGGDRMDDPKLNFLIHFDGCGALGPTTSFYSDLSKSADSGLKL